MRNDLFWALVLLAWPAMAGERRFDFAEVREGETPPGFLSVVTGQGKPGDWRVILDEVPPLMPALSSQAPSVARKPVLAQLAQDPTDEHFPLLIYEGEVIDDFTLTTRFKTVKGVEERMAGIAFRIQNATNYYVVRASSLGNNLRFYKVPERPARALDRPCHPHSQRGLARVDGRVQGQQHPVPAQRQGADYSDR